MTIYEWRDGAGFGVEAGAAGAEVERIRRRDGFCGPEALVEEARDESSPVHGAFDWDDASAAHAHRVEQARRLIRSLVVVREDREPTIAFLSVRTPEGRGYVDAETVASSADLHRSAIAEAIGQLRGWTRRYAHIKGLEESVALAREAIAVQERKEAEAKPRARPKRRQAATA